MPVLSYRIHFNIGTPDGNDKNDIFPVPDFVSFLQNENGMKLGLLMIWIFTGFLAQAQKRRVPGRTGNESERQAALVFLNRADTLQQSIHWPFIKPGDFLDNVKRNISDPYKMNTGRNTNFCAFGAVSYTCLKNEPFRYAQSMLDLYKNGKAFYRDISLDPPEEIKSSAGRMIFQGDLDINPADQAWYLSLAHRFKGYLNFFNRKYQRGDENTMWAATNLAKFNRMLRKLCKYKVSSKGSDLIRPGSANLPAFLEGKLKQGEVYLYLNNSVLRKKNHNRLQKWIPTHYVVLLEINYDEKGEALIKYWDGGYKTLKEVSVSSLKQVIYGISWVKYNEKRNE